MTHDSETRPISWFREQAGLGHLSLKPFYQRNPVWSRKERCALIESILLDVPIPEVYVHVEIDDETSEEKFWVVDGQQRIRTVLQFLGKDTKDGEPEHNGFSLDRLKDKKSRYSGLDYDTLPTPDKKRIIQYKMSVRFLRDAASEEEVKAVFRRINAFSMPLRSQELRHATYEGPFMKLSENLADDSYWAENKIVSPFQIRRMTDIEMISDLLIGLLHGPQDGGRDSIDRFYDEYEPYEDEFPEQKRVTQRFKDTHILFKELVHSPPESRWSNRGDFYSLFIALGRMVGEGRQVKQKRELRRELADFAASVDEAVKDEDVQGNKPAQKYAKAITKGVNSKARRQDRHDILLKLIAPYFAEKA